MAYFLPHLHSAYAVDCAIQDETDKLVVIRFGHDTDKQCMLVGIRHLIDYHIARRDFDENCRFSKEFRCYLSCGYY